MQYLKMLSSGIAHACLAPWQPRSPPVMQHPFATATLKACRPVPALPSIAHTASPHPEALVCPSTVTRLLLAAAAAAPATHLLAERHEEGVDGALPGCCSRIPESPWRPRRPRGPLPLRCWQCLLRCRAALAAAVAGPAVLAAPAAANERALRGPVACGRGSRAEQCSPAYDKASVR